MDVNQLRTDWQAQRNNLETRAAACITDRLSIML
jgi:hypothetical protein